MWVEPISGPDVEAFSRSIFLRFFKKFWKFRIKNTEICSADIVDYDFETFLNQKWIFKKIFQKYKKNWNLTNQNSKLIDQFLSFWREFLSGPGEISKISKKWKFNCEISMKNYNFFWIFTKIEFFFSRNTHTFILIIFFKKN